MESHHGHNYHSHWHQRGSVDRFRRRVDAIFEEFDRDFVHGAHANLILQPILSASQGQTSGHKQEQNQGQADQEFGRTVALTPRRGMKSHKNKEADHAHARAKEKENKADTDDDTATAALVAFIESEAPAPVPAPAFGLALAQPNSNGQAQAQGQGQGQGEDAEQGQDSEIERWPFDVSLLGNRGYGYGYGSLANATARSRLDFHMDIYETSGAFVVEAEFAGIAREDVKIRFQNGTLTLSAERRPQETKETGRIVHRSERVLGVLSRSVQLPPSVDADKISAKFELGLLAVTLPKRQDAETGRDIVIS